MWRDKNTAIEQMKPTEVVILEYSIILYTGLLSKDNHLSTRAWAWVITQCTRSDL